MYNLYSTLCVLKSICYLVTLTCMQGREKFSMTENAEMRGVGLHV